MPESGLAVPADERRRAESSRRAVSGPEHAPSRRTIVIQGRGAERRLPPTTDTARRRQTQRRHERAGFRPERAALWAFLLGLMLILAAAASAHAALLHP